MMRFYLIDIEKQKTLRWIPLVNIFLLFIWQRNCARMGVRARHVLSGVLSAFACVLPFALIQAVCGEYFPKAANICAICVLYLAPLSMSSVLIWHQKRIEQLYSGTHNAPVAYSKRQIILFAVPIILVCALVIVLIASTLMQKHIPDQNGPDNCSLAVLTIQDILSGKDSSVSTSIMLTKSGSSTQVEGRLEDMDRDRVKLSVRTFSGVKTVHATKSTGDVLKLLISSELQSGNAELVVVVDGEYYCTIALNTTEQITLRKVAGKLVEVRLAGESAKISVTIQREIS